MGAFGAAWVAESLHLEAVVVDKDDASEPVSRERLREGLDDVPGLGVGGAQVLLCWEE